MNKNRRISNLIRTEDWLSVWIGAIVIILGCVAVLSGWFDFSALSFKTWTAGETLAAADAAKTVPLGEQLGTWTFWGKCLKTVLILGTLFGLGVKLQGVRLLRISPCGVPSTSDAGLT